MRLKGFACLLLLTIVALSSSPLAAQTLIVPPFSYNEHSQQLPTAASVSVASSTPIRIACGHSQPYTDKAGNVWQADGGFGSGTSTYSTAAVISGTPDPALYQTLRYTQSSSMTYTFSVPNGVYNVNLLFAELWSGAFSKGVRVFGVKINGTAVLTNFDVFAKVGSNTADTETFPVTVTNGNISIEFDAVTPSPIINAIDIEPSTAPPPPPPPPPNFAQIIFGVQLVNCTKCDATDNVPLASASIYQGASFSITQDGQNVCQATLNANAQASCTGPVNIAPQFVNLSPLVTDPTGKQLNFGQVVSFPSLLATGIDTGKVSTVKLIVGFDATTMTPRSVQGYTQ
jgi:hypothetical protein